MIPAIDVRSVHKRYGSFEALRGVSLEIAQGEFFGLLGPNGAGKTSLISIVAGLNRPSSGDVRVMGHDVVGEFRAARRALGVVPQELVFDPFFTVRETLRLTSGYYGLRDNDRWIDEILESLDLAGKADANMRALSGGMKRRVLVAQALVHRPPVIVLDEPTAGVDVALRQALWRFVQRLNRDGHTIVLTTHYLEEAQELCGRIAMLKEGRVVALDRTADLLARFGGGTVSLRLAGAPLPHALHAARVDEPGPDGRIALRLDDWQALEPMLAQLRLAGCRIEEMELAHTDLEDVFVRITGGGAGGGAGVSAGMPAAGGAGPACLRGTAAPQNGTPPRGGTSA
jgi:ABC-2 type transport system ATP-binding protein